MGLMNFLNKTMGAIEKYGPEAINYIEKAHENAEKTREKKAKEIEQYQLAYVHLKDQELLNAYHDESTPIKKRAIRELLEHKIETYKSEYRCYTAPSLINFFRQRTSPLEKLAISGLLEDLDYERDSSNTWARKQN